MKNDFFTKNRVKTALRAGLAIYFFVNEMVRRVTEHYSIYHEKEIVYFLLLLSIRYTAEATTATIAIANGISGFVNRREGDGGAGDGLEVDGTDGEGAGISEGSGVDVAVSDDVGAGVGVVGVGGGYVPRPRDRCVNDGGGPFLARGASTDPLRSPMQGVVVLVIFTQT